MQLYSKEVYESQKASKLEEKKVHIEENSNIN